MRAYLSCVWPSCLAACPVVPWSFDNEALYRHGSCLGSLFTTSTGEHSKERVIEIKKKKNRKTLIILMISPSFNRQYDVLKKHLQKRHLMFGNLC